MPTISKVKHYFCAMFYQKMKNMKNFRFYQQEIALNYWVAEKSFIKVDDYSADLQCYYVSWFNGSVEKHRWIDLDDMKTIRRCIVGHFGCKNHSFAQWSEIINLVINCQPDELLSLFSF